MRRTLLLCVWMAVACSSREALEHEGSLPAAAGEAPGEVAAPEPAPSPWGATLLDRVVVLGASASAGFGLPAAGETRFDLAFFLDAALPGEHAPVQGFASEYFFLNPRFWSENLTKEALACEPTLVVAIDFLFWFAYGFVQSEEARGVQLRSGFRLLEKFQCPVLVGDIPDMSDSIGKMLLQSQVPRQQTFPALNEAVADWVRGDPRRLLLPLTQLLQRMRSGEDFELPAGPWRPGSPRQLLQPDDLHPTFQGLALLALITLDTAGQAYRPALRQELEASPEGIVQSRVPPYLREAPALLLAPQR